MSFFKTCTAFQTKKSKVLWQAWKPRPSSVICVLENFYCNRTLMRGEEALIAISGCIRHRICFGNSPLILNSNTTLWAKMSNERCQVECVPRFWAYGSFQFSAFLTVARNLSLKFWYKTRILKEQFEGCAARTPSLNFCFRSKIVHIAKCWQQCQEC